MARNIKFFFGSTAVVWSPLQLTNLKMWVKSDVGITFNGANVSAWADQSGNGNHLTQATSAAQPGYSTNQINGKPAIIFDGVNDVMSNMFTLTQPETIFFIGKQITWTSNDTIFDGNSGGNTGRLLQNSSTPRLDQYAGSFGASTTDLAVNTYALITSIYNGTSSKLQINNGTTSTGNAGSANMAGFTIGAYGNLIESFSNIAVAEIAIMSAEATADERTEMKNYVSTRYGISM